MVLWEATVDGALAGTAAPSDFLSVQATVPSESPANAAVFKNFRRAKTVEFWGVGCISLFIRGLSVQVEKTEVGGPRDGGDRQWASGAGNGLATAIQPCTGFSMVRTRLLVGGRTAGRQSAQSSVMASSLAGSPSALSTTSITAFVPAHTKAMDFGFTSGLAMAAPMHKSKPHNIQRACLCRKLNFKNMDRFYDFKIQIT